MINKKNIGRIGVGVLFCGGLYTGVLGSIESYYTSKMGKLGKKMELLSDKYFANELVSSKYLSIHKLDNKNCEIIRQTKSEIKTKLNKELTVLRDHRYAHHQKRSTFRKYNLVLRLLDGSLDNRY